MRAAIYARVSTLDQEPENQLQELRRYVEARGWLATEYVDRGVSGAKDRRPALDTLLADAKRRRFDVAVCWRLDRLGRNLKHLIALLDDFQALGVAFVSLAEGIDATTPAGKLQMHILGRSPSSSGPGFRSGSERVWRAPGRKVSRWVDPDAGSIQNGSLASLACPHARRRGASGFRGRPSSVGEQPPASANRSLARIWGNVLSCSW